MAHHYSPKSVLRHLPLDLVRAFLSQQHISTGDDWESLSEGDTPSLCRAWLALPPADCQQVELMLRHVHELASEAGVRAMIAEALHRGRDIAGFLEDVPGHEAKALWVLLNHPPAFHTARQLLAASAPAGRYWHLTTGFGGRAYDASRAAIQNLRVALSHLYREQARGQRCTIEEYDRADGLFLFVYLDDYATTHTTHNHLGKLVRAAVRPAFEVVYVYRPAAGTLDMYARGERRWRHALRDLFCEHILGCQPPPAPREREYRLNHLLDRAVPLPIDPPRGVLGVTIRSARIIDRREAARRVDLGANPDRARDVYDMLDAHFPADRFPRSELYLSQAVFAVSYRHGGEDRSFTFQVTFPDACNLRSLPEDQRAVGEWCLRRWGILHEGGGTEPADGPADAGGVG